MNRKIFLDLDGVMADFEGHFLSQFGIAHNSVSDKEMWKKIDSLYHFFWDLPLMDGAVDFFKSIEKYNPIILTSCPKTNYQAAAIQKKKWVKKYLSQEILVLPILGGRNKALFMHNEGDILIDDMEKNCVSWTEHEGYAIRHKDFDNTTKELNLILRG